MLANLFLHYVFDDFMTKAYPNIWWERYADDGVLHCQSYKQAAFIKQKLEERFQQFGLELNKEKTRIVYCKDNRRPQNYSCTQFTFLGYTFRPRLNKNKEGKFFVGFTPAVSEKAKTAMKQKIRGWKIQLKADLSLKDIGNMIYCLNRRSQKKSYNWVEFLNMLDNSYPLVRPRIYVNIYE